MSSATEREVRKLEAERDRLAAELQTLQKAMGTKEACLELIRAVEKEPEPLSPENAKDNPWIKAVPTPGGCCPIM